ncbi:MAG TPA: ABC transporter ATP-binding protein [Rhodopila sp.]|nr:ABC transporter ATP-binding protein [Rhodopila sp.]
MNAVLRPVAFSLSDVAVSYTRGQTTTTPLANFSVHIGDGEITCLLGPSGCGKTTLLKALGGFVPAVSGSIDFGGRQIQSPIPDVVMIFQDHNLFPWLTVRQNVAFGLRYARKSGASQPMSVDHMLELISLTDSASLYPHQLSGGMRQRAAIARALVIRPKVLLLDEPFSALDAGLRRRMQHLLRDVWASTKTTMVMVTHNIEEAILVGHRVIVLGNRPTSILLDVATADKNFDDRYSSAFLGLQRQIEAMIE